jgi:hypothetical protein
VSGSKAQRRRTRAATSVKPPAKERMETAPAADRGPPVRQAHPTWRFTLWATGAAAASPDGTVIIPEPRVPPKS